MGVKGRGQEKMTPLSGTLPCPAFSIECRKLHVKSQCKCSVRLAPLPTRLLHPMSFLSRTSGTTQLPLRLSLTLAGPG